MKTLRLEEMTWQEVKQALAQGYRRAILALGSIEQHGPHLPLVTDTLIGDTLALRVAEQLGSTLIAPTIRPGCSDHHMRFAGSLSISSELLAALTRAYCESLAQHGFETIFLLPSHGGNFATVARITPELNRDIHVKIIGYSDLVDFQKTLDGIAARFGLTPVESGAHAGSSETSIILAERADLVHMDRAQLGFAGDFVKLAQELQPGAAGFTKKFDDISPTGVLGDPRNARAEIGRALIEESAKHLAEFYRAALA